MRRSFREQFEEKYGKITEDLAAENAKFLKTKPEWFPMFVWIRLLRIFVKIKK
jgi:hypothetical protein